MTKIQMFKNLLEGFEFLLFKNLNLFRILSLRLLKNPCFVILSPTGGRTKNPMHGILRRSCARLRMTPLRLKYFFNGLSFGFWILIATFVFVPTLCANDAHAEAYRVVTAELLLSKPKLLNQQMVVFKGEAIGDIMPRGDYAWVNVQDDTGVMGIWATREQAGAIQYLGDYLHTGDIIKVKGQFWRADPKLQGEMCIRAHSIEILQTGKRVQHAVSPAKTRLALVLGVLTAILLILRWIIERKA